MERKKLREGYTTGTCAAGAALGSTLWQITGECPEKAEVELPSGARIVLDILPFDDFMCGVVKDGGDDPDETNGCVVQARTYIGSEDGAFEFVGGEGVGTVTLDGLKIPVGEPAINPVPRSMIEKSVRSVIGNRSARIVLSVPDGRRIAKRTFNERVGVVDGISILGTTGIVRPMSEEAIKESLYLELNVVRKKGHKKVCLVPGFSAEKLIAGKTDMPIVQMSNYVGFMLDSACELGFEYALIFGGTGKLVKLAAGIMNTHSHEADARCEVICTHAALLGADTETVRRLFECATTKAAQKIIEEKGLNIIWQKIAERAKQYCTNRVYGEMGLDVVLTDDNGNIMADTRGKDDKK